MQQLVERAFDAARTLVHDVRIDHRRRNIPVPEQFLNRPDIVARLQEMRGKRVAQCMAADRLDDCRGSGRVLDGPVQRIGIKMVTPDGACLRLAGSISGRSGGKIWWEEKSWWGQVLQYSIRFP